jgi:tetratricopeptide (TPR) repeat protein
VALKPDWTDAHISLGIALAALGDIPGAKTAFTTATRLDGNASVAWSNLGALHLAEKNAKAAVAAFEAAVAALTGSLATGSPLAQALNGLGVAYTELGRHDDALDAFARGLAAVTPGAADTADLLTNRAVTLQAIARWSESLDDLVAAGAIAPDRAAIWRNMAKSLVAVGRIDDAEAACTRATALDGNDAIARYERSFVRLLAGQFAAGFDDYRYRPTVDRARVAMPREPLPLDLRGRRFRLVLEQGLGEHLFFLRYAAMIRDRGATLAVEADAKLLPLLHGCAALADIVPRDTPTAGFEPLLIGDLPFLTGATTAPSSIELTPDPALADEMTARLSALGPPPYVALTWRAGIQDGKSLSKTISLEALAAALRDTRATLLSIQRAPLADETATLATLVGRPVHDLSSVNDDLARMLALLSVIDDYVGVSNTNMHLRAALRRPARVLVPHPPEFRWLARGDRSPWFPEFTVYRAESDWDAALARLAADLRA